MCPMFKEDDSKLQPWMQFMKQVLDMQVPAELEAPTDDMHDIVEKDKDSWWKLKGRASMTTFRIYSKNSDLTYCKKKSPEYKYRTFFVETYG